MRKWKPVCLASACVALGMFTRGARADLIGGTYSSTTTTSSWPGTPAYSTSLSGTSAQGLLSPGTNATQEALAETFTPTSTFTLGAIAMEVSGGASSNNTIVANLFPLTSNPGISSGSAAYNLSAEGSTDLLGGGSGLSFAFPGFSGTDIITLNLSNGPTTDDQPTLTAGTTYALEAWEPAGTTTMFWFRSSNADPGGQAFSSDDASLGVSRNTLNANGQAGGAPRTFAMALYPAAVPEPASLSILGAAGLGLLLRRRSQRA